MRPPEAIPDAQARGLTSQGEPLFIRRSAVDGPMELWLVDGAQPEDPVLIRRTDPGVQVVTPTGSGSAIIWREERGQDLVLQDWSVWRFDRSSRTASMIGERALDGERNLMPTPEVRPTIADTTTAWSASVSAVANRLVVGAYVARADAPAAVVANEAYWASPISAVEVEYVAPAVAADGTKVNELRSIRTDGGSPSTVETLGAAPIAGHAASARLSIITGDHRVSVRDRGSQRTVSFTEDATWPVAGTDAAAWISDLGSRLYALGDREPRTLANIAERNDVFASGPWFGWVSGGSDAAPEISFAKVVCQQVRDGSPGAATSVPASNDEERRRSTPYRRPGRAPGASSQPRTWPWQTGLRRRR